MTRTSRHRSSDVATASSSRVSGVDEKSAGITPPPGWTVVLMPGSGGSPGARFWVRQRPRESAGAPASAGGKALSTP